MRKHYGTPKRKWLVRYLVGMEWKTATFYNEAAVEEWVGRLGEMVCFEVLPL